MHPDDKYVLPETPVYRSHGPKGYSSFNSPEISQDVAGAALREARIDLWADLVRTVEEQRWVLHQVGMVLQKHKSGKIGDVAAIRRITKACAMPPKRMEGTSGKGSELS